MVVSYCNFHTSIELYISCFHIKLSVVVDALFILLWESISSEMGDNEGKCDGRPSF